MKKLFTFFLTCFLTVNLFAQDKTISGQVIDESTNAGLPGVTVIIDGTSNGTATDVDGMFKLTAAEGDLLKFSFIGYASQTVAATQNMTISLAEDISQLGEVLVVGYGIQKKSVVTGAISSVSKEDIAKTSVSMTTQAIQGLTPGVTVIPTSGAPGSGMKIRIRGANSNGNSDPIYIVDGMKTGNIDFIDPNDIESMEILKDAASAAIYGSEAGNGVIIITTKNGSKEQGLSVSYNMQYGIQSVRNKADMMNAEQYSIWLDEIQPAGVLPDPTAWKGKEGTNWQDEMYQNAGMARHNLAVSGGNQMSSFMLSANYFDQDGVVGGDATNFKRTTFRFNSEHDVKKWLIVGNNFAYTHSNKKSITEDDSFNGVVNHAMLMDPTTPVSYALGSTLPAHVQASLDAGNTLIKNEDGEYYGISERLIGEIGNPLAELGIANGQYANDVLLGNMFATIKPVEGLELTSRIGLEQVWGSWTDWSRKHWFNQNKSSSTNTKTKNRNTYKSWLWENFATYTKSFGSNNLSVMVGMSAQENKYEFLNTQVSGMIKESEPFTYYGNSAIDGKVSNNMYESSLYSYFGRLTYDYDEKYLFQFSLRNDNSSLFAPGKRAGYFPALSAGWVLSNEDFWSVGPISYLKVRGSWGKNGSTANVGAGQYLSLVTKDGLKVPNASETGYYTAGELVGLPNEDLTWETTQQLDLGFDLRALDGKFNLGFDYYNKVTQDLLTPSSPPPHLGYNAPYANAGDVTNKGIELDLGWQDYSKELKYGINFNLTTLNNEVTYLNPLLDRVSGSSLPTLGNVTYFEQGLPIWYFRGYKTDGIFQNQQQIDDYRNNVLGNPSATYTPQPGDPIVVDVDGNGDISASDQTYIGDPHPDLMLSAIFNAEYKGFDFRLFIQGAFGQDAFFSVSRTDNALSNRATFFFEERWTGEGSTNTGFRPTTSNEFVYKSDLMIKNSSYAKIKQIQIGYNFNSGMINKIGLQGVRAYVSLDDFFTFTKYQGADPELGSNNNNSMGIDRGMYPVPSRFMMGLSVNF